MDNSYYYDQIKKSADLMDKSAEKQVSFFQHILLVSSGTLGIVISLHSDSSGDLCNRLVFALSVVLLALGTLCTALVLYDHSQLLERARQAHMQETQNALQEDRPLEAVFVGKKKRTLFCEKASCRLLVLSIMALTCYSVLTVL